MKQIMEKEAVKKGQMYKYFAPPEVFYVVKGFTTHDNSYHNIGVIFHKYFCDYGRWTYTGKTCVPIECITEKGEYEKVYDQSPMKSMSNNSLFNQKTKNHDGTNNQF